MHNRLQRVLIPLGFAALLAASAVAAPSKPAPATKPAAAKPAALKFTQTTVKTLLAEPKKWDKKPVAVEGTVAEYEQRTSAAGHDYSKFKLMMPDVKEGVAVFSFTHLGLAGGKKVRV